MTPDEIRRSWDDDDTPRSHFPTAPFTQPRADRDAELVAYDQLSRENVELRAEVKRLRADKAEFERWRYQWVIDMEATVASCAQADDEAMAAEARLDALVAAAATAVKAWDDFATCEPCPDCLRSGVGLVDFDSDERMDQATDALRAVLDKHAGEQP
jgi:hypothetical protein